MQVKKGTNYDRNNKQIDYSASPDCNVCGRNVYCYTWKYFDERKFKMINTKMN